MSQDKSSLTPAQKKLDSQLLIAIRQRRGEPTDRTGTTTLVKIDSEGNTIVDISCTVTPALLAGIERLGGKVIFKYEEYHTVRARVSLAKLETLAALDDVRFVMPAAEAMTNRPQTNQPPTSQPPNN